MGEEKMGKISKIFLVLSIIVTVGSASIMIAAKVTQTKLLWNADGDEFSGNNTVTLKGSVFIIEASYYFQYFEETTMSFTVSLTNTATAEVKTVDISVSPQSSYIETISTAEIFEITNSGEYTITYSCSHPYFSAASSGFTLVKPSLFSDLADPEQIVSDAEMDIPSPAFRFSGLILLFSVLALIISLIAVLPEIREKRAQKTGANVQTSEVIDSNQQQIYSYQQQEEVQHQWQPSETEQTSYQGIQQESWTCSYCNAENSNTGRFCVSCGKERSI